MNKDKAWLKNEVKSLFDGAYDLGKMEYYESEESIDRINSLIDQLDEPEVLSRKWIDENVVEGDFRGGQQFWYGRFIEEEKLKNLLVPKQGKPEQTDMNVGLLKVVIPQFIADWYEENLLGGYTNNRNKFSGNDVFRVIQDVLKSSQGLQTWGDYGIDEKITAWAEENEEDFIHLIANCSYKDGYEVEKEPVYYAKIKGHELVETETILDEDTGDDISEFCRNVHFVLQRNGELVIDMKDSGLSGAKHFMTMTQWNNLGINETNADFEEFTAPHG